MPSHAESRILPFTADQMFGIVADVEHYPEFVPGCSGLRVRARERRNGADYLTAEMLVSYGTLRERYISEVTLDREGGRVEARHIEGPFDHLDTRWLITPHAEGCEVRLSIDFAFKSRLLSAVSALVFDGVARRMADAFIARAEQLYGKSEPAQQQA